MSPSLLIVEPEGICREPLAKLLEIKGYGVQCAKDGIEALRALRASKPDLVLLTLTLARLSGMELLRVMRRTPPFCDLPVIVLTDAMQPDVVRCVGALGVKDFLLKSTFSVDDVLDRIKRNLRQSAAAAHSLQAVRPASTPANPAALQSRASPAALPLSVLAAHSNSTTSTIVPKLLSREQVLERVEKCAESKTLAGVVSQIVSLASSPRGSVADLVSLLRQDVVLATRVLQVANTAAYASNKPRITTIEDAVRNVGLGTVRNIALSVGVFEAFPPDARDGFNLIRCWQHSVGVAAILDRLTATTDGFEPGAAHLVGLCHDIGEVVLRQCLSEQYDELAGLSGGPGMGTHQVESAAFGIPYPELIDRIMNKLELPQTIAAPIRECAERRRPFGARPVSKLGQALLLADGYAHGLQLASSPRASIAPISVAEYRAVTGATRQVAIDGEAVRCEVLCNISLLARLSAADERELAKPFFPRFRARLWYARHAALSSFDPLECALQSLAEVTTHERLPLPSEGAIYDGLVIAAPRHDHSSMPLLDVERVSHLAGGKRFLYLTGTTPTGAQPIPAELRQYPVPFAALAEFASAVATAASVVKGRVAEAA